MKRFATLALLIAFAVAASAQATANLSAKGYYADPEIRFFDHQFWIYPTASNTGTVSDERSFTPQQTELRKQHVVHAAYLSQTSLDAFSSPDLVHWTKHPRVLSVKNVPWAAYAVWAPSAIYRNGKYYLFFAANDIQKKDTFDGGIGVAVSKKPGGARSRTRWASHSSARFTTVRSPLIPWSIRMRMARCTSTTAARATALLRSFQAT